VTAPDTFERAARASQPEDDFVALFAQVFGFEKTQLLAPEYPVADIYGTTRYIDFALKAAGRMIAFEVDGPTHYAPPDFDLGKFEDDLLRQNSLIHLGWQVFRWTLRDNPYLLAGNAQFSDADELLADIRRAKGWTDKAPTYLREYTGVWAASNDIGVYELKPGSVCPVEDLPPVEADDQWGLGIDLGYQSDSAFVVLRFNRRLGSMLAVDSYSQGKMLVGDVARKIKDYEAHYDLSFVVADAGGYGQSIVQALRLDYGMHVHTAVKDDKAGTIRRLNDALATHRLRISDACHDLVGQMSKLQWSRSHLQGGKRVENKKSSPNHATDALLYAFRHAQVSAGEWDTQGPEAGTPSYVDQQIEDYWEERERQMTVQDDWDGFEGLY